MKEEKKSMEEKLPDNMIKGEIANVLIQMPKEEKSLAIAKRILSMLEIEITGEIPKEVEDIEYPDYTDYVDGYDENEEWDYTHR